MGRGWKRSYGAPYTGTQGETPDTAKGGSYGLPRQSFTRQVYFKEAKQHLGFLKEQTVSFASHTASIHLCAIRYLMLVHNKLEGPESHIGSIRSQIQEQLDSLSFAARLWQIFRAIISGTLNELHATLGCSVDTVMLAIDKRVQAFFICSLQLDTFTMRLEYE